MRPGGHTLGRGRRRAAGALCAAALAAAAPGRARGGETNHAARLLARLGAIRTVACEVRRETETGAGRLVLLSRVFYQRPDRLHVENYAPVRRRIVCDGTNFVSHVEGQPRAFARRVDELSPEMLAELRREPGTAADQLLRLRDLPESVLPSPGPGRTRLGYAGARVFTVLELDARDRVASVTFHADRGTAETLGEVVYDDYREVLPGCWVAMKQDGWSRAGGVERRERVRVSRFEVNTPLAPGLFRPAAFVPDVEFVDTFEALAP